MSAPTSAALRSSVRSAKPVLPVRRAVRSVVVRAQASEEQLGFKVRGGGQTEAFFRSLAEGPDQLKTTKRYDQGCLLMRGRPGRASVCLRARSFAGGRPTGVCESARSGQCTITGARCGVILCSIRWWRPFSRERGSGAQRCRAMSRAPATTGRGTRLEPLKAFMMCSLIPEGKRVECQGCVFLVDCNVQHPNTPMLGGVVCPSPAGRHRCHPVVRRCLVDDGWQRPGCH